VTYRIMSKHPTCLALSSLWLSVACAGRALGDTWEDDDGGDTSGTTTQPGTSSMGDSAPGSGPDPDSGPNPTSVTASEPDTSASATYTTSTATDSDTGPMPQCERDFECGRCYVCYDGQCWYDSNYCGLDDGAYYECYSDSDCVSGAICDYGSCYYIPTLEPCQGPAFDAKPWNLNQGSYPVALAFGDVDQDLDQDVWVALAGHENLTILAGDGAGNVLGGIPQHPLSLSPVDLAVTQLGGDDMLDAVAPSGGNVAVAKGAGGGSFSSEIVSLGAYASQMEAADLNLDGLADLIGCSADGVFVSLAMGPGEFYEPSYVGAACSVISVADVLYGDGIPDLIVGNPYNRWIDIMLGDGTGWFAFWGGVAIWGELIAVDVGDMNGDSFPDIVAMANGNGVGVANIIYKDTSESFYSAYFLGVNGGVHNVALGDLTSDGDRDIWTHSNVSPVLQRVTADCVAEYPLAQIGVDLAAGHLNADGRTDIASVDGVDTVTVFVSK